MHPYIKPLEKAFKAVADKENAVHQQAYMRDQFPFFGIKTDIRRNITNAHFKNHDFLDAANLETVVKELWALPMREYQYAGQELLYFHRNHYSSSTIKLLEYCITHKSWWDTVDALNGYPVGTYFTSFPGKKSAITKRWNRSSNIWLNRSSLLFQLKYKKATDITLLSEYILHLSSSKAFFIQKAIGWILREYAKTDPDWVRNFVKNNTLAPLSKREALKNIANG